MLRGSVHTAVKKNQEALPFIYVKPDGSKEGGYLNAVTGEWTSIKALENERDIDEFITEAGVACVPFTKKIYAKQAEAVAV